MVVKKFVFEEHFNTINSWANERGITMNPLYFSPNGYIIYNKKEEPFMVAFIYFLLDVPIIQIDNLYTKPGCHYLETLNGWNELINFVKTFISEIKTLSGQDITMIRAITNKRLGKALSKLNPEWKIITNDATSIGLII